MVDELFEQLRTRAELCGVHLNSEQLEGMSKYCTILAAYNDQINLVSRSDLDFLLFEHVLDSLSLIPLIENLRAQSKSKNFSLVDIGSGAGFPGLVLAMICPELHVCLVEATGKKCKFLSEAIITLKLPERVRVINDRAETIGLYDKYRGKFQFATARAVGTIELITELSFPLLEEGGYLLAQKSQAQVKDELASGEEIFPLIGANLEQIAALSKEALGKERVVLIIKKVKATPKQFPRPFSKITKRKL
jgi:16S rRNA (guanine527-N7)-methyltransferase